MSVANHSEGHSRPDINPSDAIARIDQMVAELTRYVDSLAPVIHSDIPDGAREHFASALLKSVLLYDNLEKLIWVLSRPLSEWPSEYGSADYTGKIAPSWPESIARTTFFEPFIYEYPEEYSDYNDFDFNRLHYEAVMALISGFAENRVHVGSTSSNEPSQPQACNDLAVIPAAALDIANTILGTLKVTRLMWEHEMKVERENLSLTVDYQQMLKDDEEVLERLIDDHLDAMDVWASDLEENERLRLHDSGYDDESFWEQENYRTLDDE